MSKIKHLTNIEISSFCRQTAMIIQAGITPAEGMDILLHDTLDKEGKQLLTEIGNACKQGETFAAALGAAQVFPDYVVRMVALGEESGNTDTVLTSLAEYYEREEDIHQSIKSAVSYPLIMITMMLLVIVVLLVKVLPIFKQVFLQLGTEMTGFASSLLSIGNVLSRYSMAITVILFLLVIGACFIFISPRGKIWLKGFLSHFKLTSSFYEKIAAGRFASGMSLTISSGLDTYQSMEMVAELVENDCMKKKIQSCRQQIEEGSNFSDALVSSNIFSNLHSRMVAVGFRSGTIDSVMKQIAKNYEDETDTQLRNIISIIEPTLVIFLSVIVGMILMSVILPLMGIMSSIG